MLNTRSNFLTILIPTFNRLALLKRTLDSIANNTKCSHEVIVMDRDSTDGTLEYLRQDPNITLLSCENTMSMTQSHNEVWRQTYSKYTVWLSDDVEVTPGALDLAVSILGENPTIGMVGLKMKDTLGPGASNLFMGGVSEYGILNCNHGVLTYDLLAALGFFNESYRLYGVDPDITASVLCAGKKVVFTKQIGVLHNREWSLKLDGREKIRLGTGSADVGRIYRERFAFLKSTLAGQARAKLFIGYYVPYLLYLGRVKPESPKNKLATYRYWNIFWNSRFISAFDSWHNRDKPYELVQSIPAHILLDSNNPYRDLAEKNITLHSQIPLS